MKNLAALFRESWRLQATRRGERLEQPGLQRLRSWIAGHLTATVAARDSESANGRCPRSAGPVSANRGLGSRAHRPPQAPPRTTCGAVPGRESASPAVNRSGSVAIRPSRLPAGQETEPPAPVVHALEVLASRAHNRIQTGWDENAVRKHWPYAYSEDAPNGGLVLTSPPQAAQAAGSETRDPANAPRPMIRGGAEGTRNP